MNTSASRLHPKCPYCGATITIHQKIRPGHCENADCATSHAVQGDKDRQAGLLATYRAEVAAIKAQRQPDIDAQAEARGVAPERVHIGAVPHSDAAVVPLPEARRAEYLAHLNEITEAAFALPAPEPYEIRRDREAEQGEPHPWNSLACGTCRGFCCQSGGAASFAFQKVETITELRQTYPDMTRDAVIAHYMSAMPELSNDGGCVFQGATGCTLERGFRSDVCNTFRCYALHRLVAEIDPSKTDAVALVSVTEKTPHRISLFVKDEGNP